MTSSIETENKRARLKIRREPYWEQVSKGRYLGYRKTDTGGTWRVRMVDPSGKRKYLYDVVGDASNLNHSEAIDKAVAWFALAGRAENHRYTLRDCVEDYIQYLRLNKTPSTASDAEARLNKWLPSRLQKLEIGKLTTAQLNRWRDSMVKIEGADRDPDNPDAGQFNYEDVRKSKDSANRVLSTLKAALNLSFNTGLVATDTEWRRVKAFEKATASRKVFLTDKQVVRVLDKTSGAFHSLCKAAILTGARYGELIAAHVDDLDTQQGTLTLNGKTGSRKVYLSTNALEYFKKIAKDRLPRAWLLVRDDGEPWGKSHQSRHMKAAVEAARLPVGTVFYSLRHYHISKALEAGLQPQMIAENCGTSMRMIELHYGKFRASERRAAMDQVELL